MTISSLHSTNRLLIPHIIQTFQQSSRVKYTKIFRITYNFLISILLVDKYAYNEFYMDRLLNSGGVNIVSSTELPNTLSISRLSAAVRPACSPLSMAACAKHPLSLLKACPSSAGSSLRFIQRSISMTLPDFPKITAGELVDQLKRADEPSSSRNLSGGKGAGRSSNVTSALFEIVTDKTTHYAKAVIITAGVGAFEPRRLELPEAAVTRRNNLHYFISDLQPVQGTACRLISGGGDSAVDWSLMLEPIAASVTLIHRRDKFRAHEHSVENLMNSRVNVLTPYEITALHGADRIERITLAACQNQRNERARRRCRHRQLRLRLLAWPHCGMGASRSMAAPSSWIPAWKRTSLASSPPGDITTYPGKLKLIAVGFGEAPTAINNAKVYVDPTAKLSPGHSSNMKL